MSLESKCVKKGKWKEALRQREQQRPRVKKG